MARTAAKRNVVVVYTGHSDGTWRGRGVEVQSDGTLALGTAKTRTDAQGGLAALKDLIRQDYTIGGTTPENSALYSHHEVHSEVFVSSDQL